MKKTNLVVAALLLALSGKAFAQHELTRSFSCAFGHTVAQGENIFWGAGVAIREGEFNYSNALQTFWKTLKTSYIDENQIKREVEITAAMQRIGPNSEMDYIVVKVRNTKTGWLEINTREVTAQENEAKFQDYLSVAPDAPLFTVKCTLRKNGQGYL